MRILHGSLVLLIGLLSVSQSGVRSADDTRALRRTPVVEVFESARDAVVNISSTRIVEVRDPFDRFFKGRLDSPLRPRPRPRKKTAMGSGFVIHSDGYIVTNAHVVARSTDRRVVFADGQEYDARVVASDREDDVAILKIEPLTELKTLPFGRSSDLMIGETVIAIGNPLGYQHTVTAGVVSAVDRDLEFSESMTLRGLIQTDASINPGNSGGPLLNVLGQLIGVNTAIAGDAQNIGFAIPVDRLRRLLPELLDVERRYHISSGLVLSPTAEPRVLSVKDGSPADRAGIAPGDLLEEIDGDPVKEVVDFHIALIGRGPGDRLSLSLLRRGRRYNASLTLDGRPQPDAHLLSREKLGVEVRPLPVELARNLGLSGGGGFVVVDVEPGSPAQGIGMRSRDVLVALGRYYPTTLEELGELLEHIEPRQQVSVTFLRVKPPTIVRYEHVLTVR